MIKLKQQPHPNLNDRTNTGQDFKWRGRTPHDQNGDQARFSVAEANNQTGRGGILPPHSPCCKKFEIEPRNSPNNSKIPHCRFHGFTFTVHHYIPVINLDKKKKKEN